LRLFVVERTPLEELREYSDGPKAGDIVAYFRAGQALDGDILISFADKEINVLRADTLLNAEDIVRIDGLVDSFTRSWFCENGIDVSRAAGVSIGMIISSQLISEYLIGPLVHSGEMFLKLLNKFSHAETVLTDILDGEIPIQGNSIIFECCSRRRLLLSMVENAGLPLIGLVPNNPIPPRSKSKGSLWFGPMIKSFIGGFRFRYLFPKIRLKFKFGGNPIIFFSSIIHGFGIVASAMGTKGKITVVGSGPPSPGIISLRFDHFLPIPSPLILIGAYRLRKHVMKKAREKSQLSLSGFDYSSFLWATAKHLCGTPLLIASIKISQTQRLLKTCRPQIAIVSSEFHTDTRTIYESSHQFSYDSVFLPDGLGWGPCSYSIVGRNFPNVINGVPGSAHRKFFGGSLPENYQPRCENIPIPLTLQVLHLSGKYPGPIHRRVLIISYGPDHSNSTARISYMDDYILSILAAAIRLKEHGIDITLRPHHGEDLSYYSYFINKTGMAGLIDVETKGSFADALEKHDLLISNVSTCYYQALYVGWPTVFFDPVCDPSLFTGLPGEPEHGAPMAKHANDLVRLVLEGLEPGNKVTEFSNQFREKLSERFIGPNANRADEVIADFLIREIKRVQG